MKSRLSLPVGTTLALIALGSSVAWARTFEYRPLTLLSRTTQSGTCPEKVISYETPRPYQEGGYTIDGQVALTAIASNIKLLRQDEFSATWIGDLKSPYATCRASAGITNLDGQPYQGHSYMRLQFLNGKVYFILDMTGNRDANDHTTQIFSTTFRDGNPRWSWGGSD